MKVCQLCLNGTHETGITWVAFVLPDGKANFSPPHPFLWFMSTGHFSDLFARLEAQIAFRGKACPCLPLIQLMKSSSTKEMSFTSAIFQVKQQLLLSVYSHIRSRSDKVIRLESSFHFLQQIGPF